MDSQQEPWRQQPVPQMTNSWYLRSRMVVKDLSRPKLFGIWLPSLAEDAQQPFGKENCTSRYPFFQLTAESNQKKNTLSSFNSLKFPNNFNTSPSLTVPTSLYTPCAQAASHCCQLLGAAEDEALGVLDIKAPAPSGGISKEDSR